jgi:hypothetical protein
MKKRQKHETVERLLQAAKELRPGIRTLADLARAVNQSEQNINNWAYRGNGVSKEGRLAIQKDLGISATWIEDGSGEMLTLLPKPRIGLTATPRPADDREPVAVELDFSKDLVIADESNDVTGTSYAKPEVAKAIANIRSVIDGQHRVRAISDDDATLLRAALRAVQANMSPTMRAAILLMLEAQNSGEGVKGTSVRHIKDPHTAPHSNSGLSNETPSAHTRRARAAVRAAAEPESDKSHETGKHGT